MTSDDPNRTAVGELMLRTFGPVAETLGIELAKLPAFASRNLARLTQRFSEKNTHDDVREMSPRLLRQVFEEAIYADEEIVAEYLSGVLASSGDGLRNDRGVGVTALIRRLSAVQLRVHYLFYSELWRHRVGRPVDLRWSAERMPLHVEFDMDEFMRALGMADLDPQRRRDVVGHAIWGLSREQLIDEDTWEFIVERGEETPLGAHRHTDLEPMLSFHPSPLGAELFLWGCGSPVIDQREYLDAGLELLISEDFPALTTTRVLDLTGYTSDARALEAARTDGRWGDILATVSSGVDAAAGVEHYYASIAHLFTGDLSAARAAMARCAETVSSDDRALGLQTLHSMRGMYPLERGQLWTLSELLAARR